ncbi:protein FAM114A2 isoform X2 [Schistocerca serialis cubense]|nr:protein FAM114A2 isoform X2 [Schistocerca serialis cubense]XP_049938056.1 protein FAM114A2 isoform X2 [Schistocerca serialis cubense]
MATSDSEAFESADEDFDFDIDSHVSAASHKKSPRDNCEVLNSLKAGGDGLVAKEIEKSERSQVIEDDKKLEDSLKSLEISETLVQVKDDSKGFSVGDKSDSSDSDGGGDSVRTLKGDNKPKQDPVTAVPIENELLETNTPSKDSSVPSEVNTSDDQIKTDADSVRSNSSSRKHEKKKMQTRETKPKSSIKKLGTKITSKSATPISDSGTSSDSVACSNQYKESVQSDSLTNTRESEKLLEPISTDPDSTVSTGMQSEKNEEKISSVLEKLTETSHAKEGSGWGGWGNWGVSSLLSTATESVSTLTSQVTHGFSSVLETGIGIPDPEELARLDAERERKSQNKCSSATHVSEEPETGSAQSVPDEKSTESQSQDGAGLFGFSRVFSGVSTITKLVESTGSKVITGGLDTLETIGKKTMEVLQEGDPGLRKKREIFSEKIILSQVLREAKERAEMEDKLNEDKEVLRKAHFETLFDDFQGLVHLEALEMLSKQCELKVEAILQSLTGQVAVELQDKMTALKELCEIPDDDADETEDQSTSDEWLKSLAESSHDLGVNVPVDKIANSWSETIQWLSEYSPEIRPQEFHHKAISSLARLTAVSVEQFHKTAELLLVKEDRDPFQEAHCLQEMTLLLSVHISILAAKFSDTLSSREEEEESSGLTSVSDIITNIFLEASNSSSYIKEAFQLIIPVLQLGVKP